MYRTGKSYLLNRMLLNRQRGFGVGPSINPCTKGLWVWGTPIQGFSPDGAPINILVVDSEGIGGLDEDNNHDMRIFSLALLLSSFFIYNSVGSIDENALSSLSLVVNLTKHIQFRSKKGGDGEEMTAEDIDDLAEYLPSFMWVVRDFALQLVDETHTEISSKEYLERALIEKGGSQDPKNDIRKHLKMFFRSRDCCTMIRPLTNEDELQSLELMELEELRSEFVEQVMLLRRKVINQVKSKTINNQVMDGYAWASLVSQYVDAINEGAVPNIQSSWNYICRERASRTLDSCKHKFDADCEELF